MSHINDFSCRLFDIIAIYRVNGKEIYNNSMPISSAGKVQIPVRVISEVFGAKVNWTTSEETLIANVTNNTKK